MERQVIQLDDEISLMVRLCNVEDSPYFREKAYRNLVQSAGQELNPVGLVNLLFISFIEMTQGMDGKTLGIVMDSIDQNFDRYIEAMVGNHPEFVQAARTHYQTVTGEKA